MGAKRNVASYTRTFLQQINNGFPTRSSKSLKLETLEIDSRLTGLKNRWQDRRIREVPMVLEFLYVYTFHCFIIVRILSLAERLKFEECQPSYNNKLINPELN